MKRIGQRLSAVLLISTAFLFGCASPPAATTKPDATSNSNNTSAPADLELRANQILAGRDNIVIRAQIDPVFEYAQQCAATGQTNKAITYFNRALEHKPWNLSAQLTLAQLLAGQGNRELAREKAELILKNAETDSLLEGASRILGLSYDSKIPDETLTESRGIILVPVGNPDAWLLRDVRDGLKQMLALPVAIQHATVPIPEPDRDGLHLWAVDLRKRLDQAKQEPAAKAQMKQLSIDSNSWATDEGAFAVTDKLLGLNPDPGQQKQFRENLRVVRGLGPQWEAGKLLGRVPLMVRPIETDKVVLAVTHLDLFSNQSRYVFGVSLVGGNRGIISYRRFTAEAFDTAPNRQRLRDRAVTQALSSVGMAYGFERCIDPTCSRAYANSLEEHDAKELKLCAQCRAKFDARFPKGPIK
jgi:predicted Zn-dependent protease